MISILYRSKMQKSSHGLTLQNGMDRGSFSTFSAVLLFVVSSLPLVCDVQYPRYAQPSAWQSDIPASLSSPDDILHYFKFVKQKSSTKGGDDLSELDYEDEYEDTEVELIEDEPEQEEEIK